MRQTPWVLVSFNIFTTAKEPSAGIKLGCSTNDLQQYITHLSVYWVSNNNTDNNKQERTKDTTNHKKTHTKKTQKISSNTSHSSQPTE